MLLLTFYSEQRNLSIPRTVAFARTMLSNAAGVGYNLVNNTQLQDDYAR